MTEATIDKAALTEKTTINGKPVTIRPVCEDDLTRERQFVERLSANSRHFRFLGGVRQLPEKELKELCNIDYDQRMALIATVDNNGEEQEIGVSRYVKDENGECECAVTVADEWQHHGLGRLLMEKLINFARDNGEKTIFSVDLANNTFMRKLAKDLDMTAKRDAEDATLVRFSLQL